MCHYTTLSQELVLTTNDLPGTNGDQEFCLDASDSASSDDEVLYSHLKLAN